MSVRPSHSVERDLYIFVRDNPSLRSSSNPRLRANRKARFYLASKDGTPLRDAQQLLQPLRRLKGGAVEIIYISPYDEMKAKDQRVPFFNVMSVMDVCKQAGFHEIRFTVSSID